jgi:hypothetical protein
MAITYKKWFSIFGLLAAIIISLGIGLFFDLSILEGATTMNEPQEPEEELVTTEEEVLETDEVPEEEEEEEVPGEEYTPGMESYGSDTSNTRNMDVYNKIMESGPSESFRCITSF